MGIEYPQGEEMMTACLKDKEKMMQLIVDFRKMKVSIMLPSRQAKVCCLFIISAKGQEQDHYEFKNKPG